MLVRLETVLGFELVPALTTDSEHVVHGRLRYQTFAIVEVLRVRLDFFGKVFVLRYVLEEFECWCCLHLLPTVYTVPLVTPRLRYSDSYALASSAPLEMALRCRPVWFVSTAAN